MSKLPHIKPDLERPDRPVHRAEPTERHGEEKLGRRPRRCAYRGEPALDGRGHRSRAAAAEAVVGGVENKDVVDVVEGPGGGLASRGAVDLVPARLTRGGAVDRQAALCRCGTAGASRLKGRGKRPPVCGIAGGGSGSGAVGGRTTTRNEEGRDPARAANNPSERAETDLRVLGIERRGDGRAPGLGGGVGAPEGAHSITTWDCKQQSAARTEASVEPISRCRRGCWGEADKAEQDGLKQCQGLPHRSPGVEQVNEPVPCAGLWHSALTPSVMLSPKKTARFGSRSGATATAPSSSCSPCKSRLRT